MAVAGLAPVLAGTAALLVLRELSPGAARVLLKSGGAKALSLGAAAFCSLAGFTLDMPWDSGSVVLGDTGWPTCCSVTVEVSPPSG